MAFTYGRNDGILSLIPLLASQTHFRTVCPPPWRSSIFFLFFFFFFFFFFFLFFFTRCTCGPQAPTQAYRGMGQPSIQGTTAARLQHDCIPPTSLSCRPCGPTHVAISARPICHTSQVHTI